MWASNYPMEDCVQYVLPNTDVPEFIYKLKTVIAENSDIEFNHTSTVPNYLYDELIVSTICFKGTNHALRVEAIEQHDNVVVRIGPIYKLDDDGSWEKNDYHFGSMADSSLGDIRYYKHSIQIQEAFEERVLNCLGKYHKDRFLFFNSVVVNFYNQYFLILLMGYLLSVILLAWSLKMKGEKWKRTTLLLLTALPLTILLVSASHIFRLRGNYVFDAQSRSIYDGDKIKGIHPLTFLIVHNNSVSEYLDEHKDIDINSSDTVYGNSLLIFAILNRSYQSAGELLEHHANPNFTSPYNGGTPLLKSLQVLDYANKPDTAFLSMVLSFGGDAKQITYDKKHNRKRVPLLEARSLDQARLLVERGGATINKDIIRNMKKDKNLNPFINDSIRYQIVQYYKSLSPNTIE